MQKLRTEISELRTGIGPPAVLAIGAAGRGKLPLEGRGHSSYDGRWEIRVRCRDVVRHPVSVGKHTVRIDDGHVKRREFEHGIASLIGAGPGGEPFARVVDRRCALQLKEVVEFSTMLRDRYVTILVKSDEDAMRQVISRATGKVGLPSEPTHCGT